MRSLNYPETSRFIALFVLGFRICMCLLLLLLQLLFLHCLFFFILICSATPPLPLLALGLLPGLDQSLPPGRLGHLLTCRRPLLSHLILLLCVLFCFPFSIYGCGLSSPHAIFFFYFVFVFFIEIFPPSWPSSLSPPSFRVLTYMTFPSAHHVPLPSYTPDSMLHRGVGRGYLP